MVGAYFVIRKRCPVAMSVVGDEAHVTCGSLGVMALEEMDRTRV
jgi:hypothetical protein